MNIVLVLDKSCGVYMRNITDIFRAGCAWKCAWRRWQISGGRRQLLLLNGTAIFYHHTGHTVFFNSSVLDLQKDELGPIKYACLTKSSFWIYWRRFRPIYWNKAAYLAPGESNLVNSRIDEHACQPNNLLLGEHLGLGLQLNAVFGHAIHAS